MPEMKPAEFNEISLSDLFNWVDSGELALPELQRPDVWQDSKIPDLLDSVYRDFPFGTMLLWTPSAGDPIQKRRFGFQKGDSTANASPAKYYLIDGQQRLTSFYLTLNEKAQGGVDSSLSIAFRVEDEEFSLVDGKIRSMLVNPREHGWYLLRRLLKMQPAELERVKWETELSDDTFNNIFGENGRLRRLNPDRIRITVYNISGRSYAEAVEIFDRINRGTKVKPSQKVLAALSTMYPGIVGEVEEYLETSQEIHGRDFDLDFFIGTLTLIGREGYSEIELLPDEYDETDCRTAIQADVRLTMDSINKAMDFMDRFLGMNTLKRIPSSNSMSCLAYAIAKGAISSDDQTGARQAAHWISRSLLTGYHYDMQRYKRDVRTLRESERGFPFDELKTNLRSYGIEREIQNQLRRLNDLHSTISGNDPIFDFLYAILRKSSAVSFPSKGSMQAARLKSDTEEIHRNDSVPMDRNPTLHRHHIYPLGQLNKLLELDSDEWLTRPKLHDIANLTFILTQDNLDIGDKPIEYLQNIEPEIRKQHMIGLRDYRLEDYKQFIRDRRKMIQQALSEYVNALKVE